MIGVGVQGVVHAVFACEKILRVIAGTAGCGDSRLVQRLHITTGAEGFLAGAFDKDRGDTVIIAPGIELRLQQINHFEGE